MYGYYISIDGIYTDNFYKQIGEYIEPGPQDVYIMIRKIGEELIINQEFMEVWDYIYMKIKLIIILH
jgi:uncharacterized membrane protein